MVARSAGVWNPIFFGHRGGNESKCVNMNESPRHPFPFDLRHVAGNALTTGAAWLMMRVLRNRARIGSVGRAGTMALQAHLVRADRLNQFRVILRAMHIMATEARDAMPVHQTLHVVVALHPVLVRSAICEIEEIGDAQPVLFERPVILQMQPDVKSNWPVIILPVNRIVQRTPLHVTLDTNIIGVHKIHPRGIDDIRG